MLAIGDKYLDYTITGYIGRGGMGTVMLAEKGSGEKAALKILHPHLLDDEELVRRFYLEAEVAGRIDCDRICKVYDVRKIDLGTKTSHAILMEYVEGECLAEMIESREAYGEEWVLHVADGVLEALDAVHRAGLLHRDIKPENIIITPDDNIKLLDLGLAKVIESSLKLTKSGYFIGTYHYASPEQLTGDPLDSSCDIYSLGIVLYELTTAARPYKSDDIRELVYEKVNSPVRPPSRQNPTLSPFFDMLVLDMLEIQPENRLSDASVIRQIIKQRENSDWYRARVSVSMSLSQLSTSTSLRRMVRVPRRTALYGRKKEFDDLRKWTKSSLGFANVTDGESKPEGMTVFIGGEAGIGKTRLVEELVGELEAGENPFVVLAGRSLQERRHVPYGPLIEMVRDFFMLENEPEIDLVALFGEYLPNLKPLIPPFLELVTHRRHGESGDARGVLNESNLLHLFQTLFTTIAGEIPIILFFDDLQWADVNTINVLNYLTSGPIDAPMMIIEAFREEELETPEGESHPLVEVLARFAGKSNVKRISLKRLDRDACRDIVYESFPGAAFIDDLTDRIYEKSEGNPFFIMEILNLLFDEGKVGFHNGRWEMRGISSEIEIPPSLRDIVAYRLERLSENEREILEAASILGYRFTSELLCKLIETPRIKLLRVLQKLEKNRRLIVCYEAGYRFDHHVVYETVYSGIIPELRVEYHRFAADILADTDDVHPVIYKLVYHLSRAGEDEDLLVYLPIACLRARDEFSNRLALEHAEWGWEAFERLGKPDHFKPVVAGLLCQRSEIAGILGEREIELQSAQAVFDLATELNDPAMLSKANRLLGEHARHVSEWDVALDKYRLALERCQEAHGYECAGIFRDMGSVYHLKGDDQSAIINYHLSLEALREMPPSSELVKTHNNLGISLKKTGQVDEAIEEFEKARTIAGEIGDLYAGSFPLGSLALIHYDAGRWELAHQFFLQLLNISEQTGDMTSRARTLLNLGNIFHQVGIFYQAENYFDESLAARRRMGHRSGEAIVLHHLAHVDVERGEYSRATDRLADAMVIHQEIGDKRGEARALSVLARVHNLAGRHKVALDCANQAVDSERRGSLAPHLIEARLEAFIARLGLGEDSVKVCGETNEFVEDQTIDAISKMGPGALKRLQYLQEKCGLEEAARVTGDIARKMVEDMLARIEDPEWRASYKLLHQDILT